MAYDDGYQKVEVDADALGESYRIIIDGFMREGEFRFREELIEALEDEVKISEVENSNKDWTDGVRYCIHLVKNIKSELTS